jgi:hypothetical protein
MLETWALDTIQEYVSHKPFSTGAFIPVPPPGSGSTSAAIGSSFTTQTPADITTLIRLAHMCGHGPLLDTMIRILRSLMVNSLQYAYLAMTLADELDLRQLRGSAYLEVMQKANFMKATSDSPGGEVDEDGKLLVNPAQRLRILYGYFHLTETWNRLRQNPPHFDHSPSCGATWHQHGCTQSWLEFWKEKTRSDAVLNMSPADVLGKLKQVQKDYDRWGSATYMHHDCKIAARRAMAEAAKGVEDKLSDYFTIKDS